MHDPRTLATISNRPVIGMLHLPPLRSRAGLRTAVLGERRVELALEAPLRVPGRLAVADDWV